MISIANDGEVALAGKMDRASIKLKIFGKADVWDDQHLTCVSKKSVSNSHFPFTASQWLIAGLLSHLLLTPATYDPSSGTFIKHQTQVVGLMKLLQRILACIFVMSCHP
jgi:hypothetical protein